MKHLILILQLLLSCFGAATAAAQNAHGSLETFEQRRQAVLTTFAEQGSEEFMRAQCLFALGRAEEALIVVNKGLDALEPGNKINRWMHGGNTGFIAWPGIDCYIRFELLMDAATRERYRRIYTGGVFYAKLSTSNHKIMAAMNWPVSQSPWTIQKLPEGPLAIRNGKTQRVYDFTNWKITSPNP